MTIATAMKMGAALPDVEQTTSWGAPTLKVHGKMMACKAINKQAEPNTLVVCMPIPDRDELIAADPDTYYLKPHYEHYPCVLVRLSRCPARSAAHGMGIRPGAGDAEVARSQDEGASLTSLFTPQSPPHPQARQEH